ncbi:TonB-dependent receptor domain-containing protein [Allosphingosinicella deserti]|uniref:TonB-dependent receptor n=1 Tax=Allosphingosinicella deserti TaxID=2116704 RepID=A0A2P7R064_9SPHN|nr:TonB-dependent receptor [Sphingomonas deserti]PSJ43599.1 TonB-dependent receptor [Sphingomonas deserti]
MTKTSESLLRTTALLAIVTASPALAGQAATQQTQDAVASQSEDTPEARSDEGPIVVTGSRIAREGFDASTPVSLVDQTDIQLSGRTNLEEILGETPQFIPSTNGGATGNTVPGGTADINLRGFGATRNLVLVNGRRFAISGPDQVTDINTIPSSLVERIEIVTGGSSAVYGSDAITGVVNFLMRDDFEGVELRGQHNSDSATWTPNYSVDLTVGGNFSEGRGNVVVSANYLKRRGITRGDRGGFAFLSLQDGCVAPGTGSSRTPGTPFPVPGGQTCSQAGGEPGFIAGGSGDIPNGRFSGIPAFGGANAALNEAYAAAGLSGLGSRGFTFDDAGAAARPALTPQDDYNLAPDNYLVVPQERMMINSFSHFDFAPAITGYLELHYSRNTIAAQLAPSNLGVPTLFDVNNPYLTPQLREVLRQLDLAETGTTTVASGPARRTTVRGDGLAVITAGRRYQEVGPRQADTIRNTYRAAIGFRGDIGDASPGFLRDLKYDVYYSYARTDTTEKLENALSRSGIQAALLSVGGAPPVCNIFGQNVSDACADAVRVRATNNTSAKLQVAAATLAGTMFDMPAGPVGFSLGVEWRKSSAEFSPDQVLSSGDVAGFNPGLPTGGSVTAKEIYGEVRIPLLDELPLVQSLTANAAFRYSDYDLSGVGGVWTYLGGLDWRVDDNIAFRGQYQRAIRAPNVNELFGGTQRIVGSAIDPCSSRQPVSQQNAAVRQVCIATGVPAPLVFTDGVQPNSIIPGDFGGNPSVGEEVSDTWTVGAVLTPRFLPNLRMSVDYFNINLEGAISPLGGGLNNTLNLCYNILQDPESEFCQAINRDPNSGAMNDPFVPQIRSANTGALKTSGIDFALRYRIDLASGLFAGGSRIDISTDWTWTNELTSTPVQAFPDIKNHCVGAFGSTCGEPVPEFRGVTRISWDTGPLTLSGRHRFIDSVTVDRYLLPSRAGTTAPALADLVYPKLPAKHYFDLSFTYDLLNNLQLFGGANNIFNARPPVVGSSQVRNNTFAATYDTLGTEVFLGASVKF